MINILFKNATVFDINTTEISLSHLDDTLSNNMIRKPLSDELETFGWDYVYSNANGDDNYLHIWNGSPLTDTMFKMVHKKRKLNPKEIKELVNAKVAEIFKLYDRKASKKEISDIKADVILGLLPSAFVETNETLVIIDLLKNRLMIDSASVPVVTSVLKLLSKTLASLPVNNVELTHDIQSVATEWCYHPSSPLGVIKGSESRTTLRLLEYIKLTDAESRLVTCKNMPIDSPTVIDTLLSSLSVTEIAMEIETDSWLSEFILLSDKDTIVLKSIQHTIDEDDSVHHVHDEYSRMMADSILNIDTLRVTIDALISKLNKED